MYDTPFYFLGADQVNAAKLCYKYALEYQKQFPDVPDVQKAFVKVKYSSSQLKILINFKIKHS